MEIKYQLVQYKQGGELKFGLLFEDIVINYIGEVITNYTELLVVDRYIAVAPYADTGIDMWTIIFSAWNGYLDKLNNFPI